MKLQRTAGLLLGLLVQLPLYADSGDPKYYAFYPTSVMSLGKGFSPKDLTEAKLPCLVVEPTPLESGALGTEATIQVVSNAQQLREALTLDANVDVSALLFKGNAHYNFSQENMFSSRDISLVIKFSTEYGRIGIKSYTESTRAAQLLHDGDLPTLKDECGTHVVLIEHRGASVAAIVTMKDSDTTQKSKYTGSLSAGMNLGALSGSMSASVSGDLDRAAHDRRLAIQVVSTGGDGFGALKALVATDVESQDQVFAKIQKALGDYIGTFNASNAAPIGFSVGPMPGLAAAETDLWNIDKQRRLAALVDEYRKYDATETDIKRILNGGDPREQVYSATDLARVPQIESDVSRYLNRLAGIHAKCKASTVSTLDSCRVPTSERPHIPAFLKPISEPSGMYFLVVDGKPWSDLKSRAVFEDPGAGTVLERAQRRQAGARSANIVYSLREDITDAQAIIGDYPNGSPVIVFYPGQSRGDKTLQNPEQLAVTVDGSETPDIDLTRIAWAYANGRQCGTGTRVSTANGIFTISLRARDVYGHQATFKLANGGFGQSGGPGISPHGIVQVMPLSREKSDTVDIPYSAPCNGTTFEYFLSKAANAEFDSSKRDIGPYYEPAVPPPPGKFPTKK
jgi:hypothetical protein